MCRLSQILKAIIPANAVPVIYLMHGPFAGHVEPSKVRRHIRPAVDVNVPMPSAGRFVSDKTSGAAISSPAPAPDQPCPASRLRVIMKLRF